MRLKKLLALLGAFVVSAYVLNGNSFDFDEGAGEGSAPLVTSYADVLEPARSAVVSVTTANIVEIMRNRSSSPMEEFMRRFYGVPAPRNDSNGRSGDRTERRIPSGLGSGVIISEDGYILTNNHVIVDENGDPADEINIHLNDGTEEMATLIGRDERTDIALLKIDRDGLPVLRMADSEKLRVGDIVFAIGNPLGVGQTSTMGIVSAMGRSGLGLLGNQGYENFIQTDAAINRGNSGGALVNAHGKLIGINTAIYSRTGGNIGIGFAIPSRLVRSVVVELIEAGTVRRGFLGVTISDLNRDLAEAFGLENQMGALIDNVQDGAPADEAGLEPGDVILTIEGEEIEDVTDLRLSVAEIKPGTEARFGIWREGEMIQVDITLGSQEGEVASVPMEQSPLRGVALEVVSAENSTEYNLDIDEGMLITDVSVRSPYAGSLVAGMVILKVNDRKVASVADLRRHLVESRVNKLWISYRGNRGFVAIRVE